MKKPAHMYVEYNDVTKAAEKNFKTEYKLTPISLGPFSQAKLTDFIDIVNGFSIEFGLIHNLDSKFQTSSSCFTWHITQNYKYSLHGPITVSLKFERGVCGDDESKNYSDFLLKKYFLLNFNVLIAGVLMIFLILKSLIKKLEIMNNLHNRSTISGAWESLTLNIKLRFISGWVIFNLIASILHILAGISGIFNGSIELNVQETVIGFSCFFSWVGIVQYLKPNANAYTVGNTLSRAMNTLGPYILGILPIFLGFVFFAMSVLWKTGNYNSLAYSMILQFAMINGDSLYSSVSVAVGVNNFLGMLYMYCFLVFFIW